MDLDHSKRMEILEDLSQRMISSGHSHNFTKTILIGGILKFEAKVRSSLLEKTDPLYKPLHQPSGKDKVRQKRKAMARSDWFKDKERKESTSSACNRRIGKTKVRESGSIKDGNEMENTTVMFVPNSKDGLLLKILKEREAILSKITGFRINFIEAGGIPLGTIFNTDCILCNPQGRDGHPSSRRSGIYIGETSRSLSERMSEHEGDARKFDKGSHIIKHWMECHPTLREIP